MRYPAMISKLDNRSKLAPISDSGSKNETIAGLC